MDAHQSYWLLMLATAASIGIASGIIGVIYVLILTQPGHVLSWWSKLIYMAYDRLFVRESEKWFKYKWVLKPILECELCVSGQLALWIYFISFFLYLTYNPTIFLFHIVGLIFCICQSILTAWAIAQKMNE